MNPFMHSFSAVAMLAAAAVAAHAADIQTMPIDEPVDVNGVALACTGIGDEAREDPRWKEYAVRLEFANRDAQYLSDVDVAVQDANGEVLFEVRCDSPWLLAKLPPAKYTVTGTFEQIVKTATFTAPKTGQSRIVVRFPEVAGDQ
jgi:hypothetical protein